MAEKIAQHDWKTEEHNVVTTMLSVSIHATFSDWDPESGWPISSNASVHNLSEHSPY